MKTIISLNNLSQPFIIDVDETLKGSISLESLHLILSQSYLGMEQSSLSKQFKDIKNGSVGAIAIKSANGAFVGRISVSVEADVITYSIDQVFSDFDLTVIPNVDKGIIGYVTPILFDISSIGNKSLDIKVVMTVDEIDADFAQEFIANISSSSSEAQSSNCFVKGATSCELYIDGNLTDIMLPFDSNFYWFGTGETFISPVYTGAAGPRFGVNYNGSSYYTDKLTSDTCKLNSIIRLHTYTDYIIFK